MNEVRIRRGRIALTRWNAVELARDAAAPNAVDVGETVIISDGIVAITIPSVDPSWSKLEIVWKGVDSQGIRRQHTFAVPLSAGTHVLGSLEDVQGRLADVSPQYAMRATDTSGRMGYHGVLKTPSEATIPDQLPQVDSVTITSLSGLGTVGFEHNVVYSVTGYPAPSIAITWMRDGVAIGGATGTAYFPVSADDGTDLTVKVEATNSSGTSDLTSDPLPIIEQAAPVVGTVTISGSGQVGSALVASVTMTNAGKPTATIGLQWKKGGVAISGATSTSYTPVAGDNGSSVTVTATATNVVGSHSLTSSGKTITTDPGDELPEIISATITGGNNAGSTHGVVIDATGTPPPTFTYQWKLGTSNAGTGATYVSPADSTAALSVIITPSNAAGVGDPYTAGPITLVRVAPPQLTPSEWSFTTSTPAPGITQLETISIPASKGAVDLDWTNSARATDQEAVDAGEFEITTLIGTTNGIQTWQVEDVFKSGSGTRNFRRYQPSVYPGDVDRAGRLSVRYQGASGLFSTRSAVKQIPLGSVDLPVVNGDWLPLHHRTKAQYVGRGTETEPQPGPGGGGYQFMRSWGNSPADPDFLFAGEDISIPQMSKDFGGWWEHPPMVGLKVGVSVQSVAIDSENADRIMTLYSAGPQRGPAGTTNPWDNYTGLYLSTDRGKTFSLRYQKKGLGGSATDTTGETPTRRMQHVICEVPGGTPATREWWAIVHIMHKGATTTNSIVIKSTNGGTAWTEEATLSAATYGLPLVLRRAANGHWWLGTELGLFKSTTNPAGTWTKITTANTGIAVGRTTEIDVAGATNEVWVSVRGNGLWKTTNGGTAAGSWTRVYNYQIETFAISPHNRNIILVAGDNDVTPQRSTNGGSSFSAITTRQMPGQPNGFEHKIHDSHAYFIFHKADPNKVFAARFQHHGISTDSGASFDWSSANFDYNNVHSFCVDPGDWRVMLMGVQDRCAMLTTNAHKWVMDDDIGAPEKAALKASAGLSGAHMGSGRGALILRNGSGRAYISSLGTTDTTTRAPYLMIANGTNPIGTFSNTLQYYGIQWSKYGINDPTNNARGYLGRNRFVVSASGAVTQGDMAKECIGIDAAGNVYAIDKNAGNRTIYKSTNPTAATPTWTSWAVLPEEPRPIDNDPRGISWDATSPNGKILLSGPTRVFLVTGGVVKTVATVANLVPASLGLGSWPVNEGYASALDPTSSAAYISLNRYGGPCVFKTTNINAATVSWTDITGDYCPKCPLNLFVHPNTGDLIASYLSGTFIYPAHVKQANSYYDEQWEAISQYQL